MITFLVGSKLWSLQIIQRGLTTIVMDEVRFNQFLKKCEKVKNSHGVTFQESYKGFENWFEDFENGGEKYVPNLFGMKKYGLTRYEAFFVLCYTGSFSAWINEDLRSQGYNKEECKNIFSSNLLAVLSKIDSFNNEIVYRSDDPHGGRKDVLSWFEKSAGSKFKTADFLSTSLDILDEEKIIWEIKTLSEGSMARYIGDLTNNKYEKEVIFLPGSSFEIIKVVDNKVFLSEVLTTNSEMLLTGAYWKESSLSTVDLEGDLKKLIKEIDVLIKDPK